MADSIRQQIMAALEDQLQTIKTSAGYNSNLGSYVYEWEGNERISDSALPCVVYRDKSQTTAQTVGQQEHTLTVELQIIANSTASVMRGIIADVTKCLGGNLTLGGLAEDIRPIADEEVIVEHNERRYFGVTMQVEVLFVTNNWDPYSAT